MIYIYIYIYIYNIHIYIYIYVYIYTPLENKNKIETDSLTSHDQLHKLRLNLINKILLLIKTEKPYNDKIPFLTARLW